MTYGITSAFISACRVPGPWRIGVSVNPANVEHAVRSAREVLRAYGEDGPTRRELDQQRNSQAGQHQVALGSNAGIAAQLERITYYGLGDAYVDTYRGRLEALRRDDVTAAIATYLGERDLIVVAAGTFA